MITSVELSYFRNHEAIRIDLSPSVTLIHGPNGAGKTSILEAIYYICRGTSFKSSDKDLIQKDAAWFRIDAHSQTGDRRASFDTSRDSVSKKFTIDGHQYLRLPLKHKYPVILFSPDDLQLLSGSPSRRRRYLDTMITQVTPHYHATLRKYERALAQRNKLLKSPTCSPDLLFSWNVLLSEYGSVIINERIQIIKHLNRLATRYYRMIADSDDTLRITYDHSLVTPQQLLHHLEEQYGRDKLLGLTTVGPHRHDMMILMNNRPALSIASRGENRTIILAFKQIEADRVKNITGHRPIILLDDVFGELDAERQSALITQCFSGYQVVVTSIHPAPLANGTMIKV